MKVIIRLVQRNKTMKSKYNCFYIGFAILACLMFGACKKSAPKNVLSEREMEDVLYDYHIAKSIADNASYEDRYKQALYLTYVFQKHETTEADFDSSLVWYSRHAEDLSKIYQKVTDRLQSQQDELNHQIALRSKSTNSSKVGNAVDVWVEAKTLRLTNSFASNKFLFTILPDSNYKERDAMLWKMRLLFVATHKVSQEAIVSMTIRYNNDSVVTSVKNIKQSDYCSIRLSSDSAYHIRDIKGFIYYPRTDAKSTLLVDNITLTRYHSPKVSKKVFSKKEGLKGDSIKQIEREKGVKDSLKKDSVIKNQNFLPRPSRGRPEDLNRPRTHGIAR